MTAPPPRGLVHLALIGVSVLFGINFVGMKIVLDTVPPLTWAMVRVTAATAILVPLTPRLVQRVRMPGRRTLLLLIPVGLLGVGLNQLLFAAGLDLTTPAHSSVLVTCVPILTLVFAAGAGQERVTGRKLLAIALAVTGVLTLLGVDSWLGGGIPSGGRDALLGDLLTLANMTGYAAFLVAMRHLGRGVDAPVSTAICFVYSTLFVSACAIPSLELGDVAALARPGVWGWALYAILAATVATYLVNVWALRHARSSLVALYIYVQPVVATSLSVALGRDVIGTRFVIASALVFLGVLVSATAKAEPD
ncbi:MAG: DMT family transporter [Planctomycetes bacterium]|nr:DMT family transporter [Planctomycetota bacterium]